VKYGSLFSGIGLLDLGVERATGWTCAFQVERDPFCRRILEKHWPRLPRFHDVRFLDGATLPSVDVLVGGFPCQDVSTAGKGAGLSGRRSGLWFDFLRIIADAAPRGIIIENVPGLIRRGLDVIVAGLHRLGYAVEGTRIRASDLGAPHRRERVFLVAHANGEGQLQPQGSIGEIRRRPNDSGLAYVRQAWAAEPNVPRVVTRSANWVDHYGRIGALGNAVVPQCAAIAATRLAERMGEEISEKWREP